MTRARRYERLATAQLEKEQGEGRKKKKEGEEGEKKTRCEEEARR